MDIEIKADGERVFVYMGIKGVAKIGHGYRHDSKATAVLMADYMSKDFNRTIQLIREKAYLDGLGDGRGHRRKYEFFSSSFDPKANVGW